MNSNIETEKLLPLAVRGSVALALTLYGAAAFAQSTITPITIPGAASLAVSGR